MTTSTRNYGGGRQAARRAISMADEAKERILEDIIQCRLRPGDMVQLSDLARQYSMSKTPVREALTLLQQDGLVEAIPYKGYVVKPINIEDVEEIFFMRQLLEGAAAELAATRINEQQLERLAALEAPSTMVMTLDYDRYAHDFHAIIAEASMCSRLANGIVTVYNDVRRLQFAGIGRPRPMEITEEHDRIVAALRARDPQLAKETMTEHIASIRKRALEG